MFDFEVHYVPSLFGDSFGSSLIESVLRPMGSDGWCPVATIGQYLVMARNREPAAAEVTVAAIRRDGSWRIRYDEAMPPSGGFRGRHECGSEVAWPSGPALLSEGRRLVCPGCQAASLVTEQDIVFG